MKSGPDQVIEVNALAETACVGEVRAVDKPVAYVDAELVAAKSSSRPPDGS